MINIHSVIAEGVDEPNSSTELPAKFHMLKGRCRIILQVTFLHAVSFFKIDNMETPFRKSVKWKANNYLLLILVVFFLQKVLLYILLKQKNFHFIH